MHSILYITAFTLLASCHPRNHSEASNNHSNQKSIITTCDTVSEIGNNIMLVFQDKKGNYWFGSWKEGLYQYNGKHILHYTTQHGLPANRIEEIKEDKLGNVYFNTVNGIIKYDGEFFTQLMVSNTKGNWKLEPNDVWFKNGWDSGKVYRYDGRYLYLLELPKTNIGDDFLLKNQVAANPYTVYHIYTDSKGNIWFGTAMLGTCRYNGNSFHWISEEDVTELHHGPSNGVRSIIEDKDGYFWFNSMYKYKVYGIPTDTIWYKREKNIGSVDGNINSPLWEYLSITRDNNNELWIATYMDGVWRYNGETITHYTLKEGLNNVSLFTIYKDHEGTIWLGTHENGAYTFNGETFEKFKPIH